MRGPVLIDTSAWIEAMRTKGDDATRAHVTAAVEAQDAHFCDFVYLELWNGVQGDRERAWLQNIRRYVKWVPTDDKVWPLARSLADRSRRSGLTLPASDLLIAACAAAHQLGLLHRDRHFTKLEEVLGTRPWRLTSSQA